MNQVALMGRLTKEPELKKTESGKAVARICLAINYGTQADYIYVEAWEKTADLIAAHLHKGNMVGIEGYLRANVWQSSDGKNRYALAAVAKRLTFAERKQTELAEPERIKEEPLEREILPEEWENMLPME